MSDQVKNPPKKIALLLGFDFGLKHIGVASGNSLLGTSSPLQEIAAKNGTPDWSKMDALLSNWDADILVVGLPLTMGGTENYMCKYARKFATQLRKRYNILCVMADERLSTFGAETEVRNANTKITKKHTQKKQVVSSHSLAACVILDTWFSMPKHQQQKLLEAPSI